MLKMITAVGLVLSLVFFSGSFAASAEIRRVTINGDDMSYGTSISKTSASAFTNSGVPYGICTTRATYVCINVDPNSPDENKTITDEKSANGPYNAYVGFSAPEGWRSVRISATHDIKLGSGSFSDRTSEDY